MNDSRCPYCLSPRMSLSQVFLCGYVEGHVQTEKCQRIQNRNDLEADDRVNDIRRERHFGRDE